MIAIVVQGYKLVKVSPAPPSDISTSYRFSTVVEDATLARLLSPAQGLLPGSGSGMLKKWTETIVNTYFTNGLRLSIML